MKGGLTSLESNLADLRDFKAFKSVISLIIFYPKEIILNCGQRFLYKDTHGNVLVNGKK
jgi:hypothetical protein